MLRLLHLKMNVLVIVPAGCAGPSLQAVGQGGQAAEDGGDVPVGGA